MNRFAFALLLIVALPIVWSRARRNVSCVRSVFALVGRRLLAGLLDQALRDPSRTSLGDGDHTLVEVYPSAVPDGLGAWMFQIEGDPQQVPIQAQVAVILTTGPTIPFAYLQTLLYRTRYRADAAIARKSCAASDDRACLLLQIKCYDRSFTLNDCQVIFRDIDEFLHDSSPTLAESKSKTSQRRSV